MNIVAHRQAQLPDLGLNLGSLLGGEQSKPLPDGST